MTSATHNRQDRRRGRASAVLRGLWLAVVVVIGLPALVAAFAQPPALARERDPKIGEAEATVDRLEARFRETLDFAPIVDEMFVTGDGRRSALEAGFGSYVEPFGGDADLAAMLDEAEKRRGYVAFLNIVYLGSTYSLATAVPNAAGETDEVEIPPAIAREMLASPYFRPLVGDDEVEPIPLRSRGDFLRWVADAEAIAGAYRHLVTTHTFDSPLYVANRERFDAEPDPSIVTRSDRDSGYLKFGVPEGETVYEVERDGVWYSLVERDGAMKVLAIAVGGD